LERSGHECCDIGSRRQKAEKIVRILEGHRPLSASRILDVGVGSGVTAAVLAERVGPRGSVCGTDVRDARIRSQGFTFVAVEDARLPFADDSFDVVVSNHVIEHVGQRPDQKVHVAEMRRVLRPDGIAYLATPNRWTVMEPHFRLPLLTWLPAGLRDGYVRLAGRGAAYDCDLLSRSELHALLRESGWTPRDETARAMRATADIEGPRLLARGLALAPTWILRVLARFSPTFVVTARRADEDRPGEDVRLDNPGSDRAAPGNAKGGVTAS
jgi:SAM-dependent methyltransferase